MRGWRRAERHAYDAVVLLGEPSYYSKFGFRRANDYDLSNEYGVNHEFMVMAFEERSTGLTPGGTVGYRPELGQLNA